MFLSAVSFGIAFAGVETQSGLTTPLSAAVATRVEKAAISVKHAGTILGRGVFISRDGYAITTGEIAFDSSGAAKTGLEAAQGTQIIGQLSVKGFDPVTDLALVKISGSRTATFEFATLAKDDSSSVVMASLISGMTRSEVSRRAVVGIMDLTKRYVPLTELRLESGALVLGGAPVFAPDGGLVGVLQASLSTQDRSANAEMASKSVSTNLVPGTQGPRPIVTGFSVSLVVLKRVVEGFLSEDKVVRHPYLGLFFANYDQGGALVGEITKDGPADRAGLLKGDVIIQAGDRPIITAVDLATHLFNQKVGDKVALTVRRAYREMILNVTVLADPRSSTSDNLTRKRGVN
ncbi:MAG: S1C family serine protease [Fimbriimonadales bacterium]